MADDRSEVLELEQRYSAAINESDVDEIDDLFADDAILMLPDDLHPNNEGYGIMADNLLGLLPKV